MIAPEDWFQRMHEAVDHPEHAKDLAHEGSLKRARVDREELAKRLPQAKKMEESVSESEPIVNYLREWEAKQEEGEERRHPQQKE